MKKLITFLFVLTFFFQYSFAQQRGQGRGQGQRMTPEQRVEMMAKRLELDDAQKKQLTEINKSFDTKMSGFRDKIREADEDERADLIASVRAIQAERSKEIKKILNEEQLKKYEEMEKEMAELKNRGKRNANQRNGSVRPGK